MPLTPPSTALTVLLLPDRILDDLVLGCHGHTLAWRACFVFECAA